MGFMVRALVAVAVGAIGFAAPAAADTDDYLGPLQSKYVFLTSEQLLNEGAKVCAMTQRGEITPNAVAMVYYDLGVSISAAGDIVSAAVTELCDGAPDSLDTPGVIPRIE